MILFCRTFFFGKFMLKFLGLGLQLAFKRFRKNIHIIVVKLGMYNLIFIMKCGE